MTDPGRAAEAVEPPVAAGPGHDGPGHDGPGRPAGGTGDEADLGRILRIIAGVTVVGALLVGTVVLAWPGATRQETRPGDRPPGAGTVGIGEPAATTRPPAATGPAGPAGASPPQPVGTSGAAPAGGAASAPAGGAPSRAGTAGPQRPGPSTAPLTGSYTTVGTELLAYRGAVRIANPGPAPVDGWTLVITLPGPLLAVSDVIGGRARKDGSTWTFEPDASSGRVPAGGAVTVSFRVNGALLSAAPTGCLVDGRPCTGLPG